MAEWSNAAVLKTVEVNASGGSNPSLSAISHTSEIVLFGLLSVLGYATCDLIEQCVAAAKQNWALAGLAMNCPWKAT